MMVNKIGIHVTWILRYVEDDKVACIHGVELPVQKDESLFVPDFQQAQTYPLSRLKYPQEQGLKSPAIYNKQLYWVTNYIFACLYTSTYAYIHWDSIEETGHVFLHVFLRFNLLGGSLESFA